MPAHNRCWFAARVLVVKRKYELTMDAEGGEKRCAGRSRRVMMASPAT